MKRRVGLFGGSFDPVHRAHLALARCALAELRLAQLRWVPAGHAWQKTRALTDARHRIAMLELVLDREPGHVIDRIEVDRPGPSYTLDTVRALQAVRSDAEWWLVLGADQYAGLHTWHGFEELLQRIHLAVARRSGTTPQADERVQAAPVRWLPLPPLRVSATDIRARIAAGEAIEAMVTPEVALYIHQHRLYAGATGS